MVLYMVDNLGLFACLLAASRAGRPMETIDDFAGLARVRPGLALAISALALSVAGIPPFSGFWAKYFYAFQPAIDAGLWGRRPSACWRAWWRPSTICAWSRRSG
jgi:NADH-quinone oxidoreductase subunit N